MSFFVFTRFEPTSAFGPKNELPEAIEIVFMENLQAVNTERWAHINEGCKWAIVL